MDKLTLFRNLMIMAVADKKITEEEIAFLSLRSSHWGIREQDCQQALSDARASNAELVIPPGAEARRELLEGMLRMMAVDGELADIERHTFAVVSATMGVSSEALEQLIDRVVQKR